MRVPTLELLWWEGCPSTDKALAQLRAALVDLGLDQAEIVMREIRTEADAVQDRFTGSPTILIDGVDMEFSKLNSIGGFGRAQSPGEGDAVAFGLNCRIYRRRDGRISPVPDPDDLREALRSAAEEVEQ